MSEWISVNDRLPMEPDPTVTFESRAFIVTDGEQVGVCDFGRGTCIKPWACWGDYGDIKPALITHWMPLPAPPSA